MTAPESSTALADPAAINDALHHQDAVRLAGMASQDELQRLFNAESVLEKKYDREQRTRRSARLATAMVGYVALAGFFANAFQNYNNKKDSEARAQQETARWEKEFKRAQDSDKYRAFFETSALATDPQNPDKRLVGYALLKEFVDDSGYNSKAIIMLEESLALELRSDSGAHGLDDQHRLAVAAILAALSHTSDCRALGEAARTVERLAHVRKNLSRRNAANAANAEAVAAAAQDVSDFAEVYTLYVRSLVGRAAIVCLKAKDFREVRQPIRDALVQLPTLGGPDTPAKMHPADADRRIAEILVASCDEDRDAGLVTECNDAFKGYDKLCKEMKKTPLLWSEEQPACGVTDAAAKAAAVEAAKEPPPAAVAPDAGESP